MDNQNYKCKQKKSQFKKNRYKFINMKKSECQTILIYNNLNDSKINQNYISNSYYILSFCKVNNIIYNEIKGKENEKKIDL